jgi:fluoride ion exporter CrcB/FEX
MEDQFITKITAAAVRWFDFLLNGSFAAFGAMAKYLYDNVRCHRSFKFSVFLTNIFLAVFAGVIANGFIPETVETRDELIIIVGFCTYPFLTLIEFKIDQFIKKEKI